MKAKRIFAGLSATVIAATLAMTASATKLTDKVYPTESDANINDAYYGLGAMGYFMNNDGKWSWNQSDWFGIDAEGKISVEYKISPILADKSMSDKGSLGEMGVMICNVDKALETAGLDDASYPIELNVTDARFVAEDGTETVFNDMLNITEMQRDAEGDIRFHIRPVDRIDEDTEEVLISATPETEGWDQEGAFNGGTLYFTIDFGAPKAEGTESKTESKADSATESKTESTADSKTDSKADSKSTTTNKNGTGTTGTTATSSAASDATDNTNSNTGAATGAVLGLMAVAAAGAIVAKKKH